VTVGFLPSQTKKEEIMFKPKIVFEVTVAEKLIQLSFDNDTKLGTLYDAILLMRNAIVEQINKANEEKATSQEPKNE
jgi:hypothetical protein